MTTSKSVKPTFTASGVTVDASKSVVTRANVMFKADRTPMTYAELEQALYHNKLQASALFRVVLAYNVDGVNTGVKLSSGVIRLAGQRGKNKELVGAAPNAHSFVKNQALMLDADNIQGTVTVGKKNGDLYFGYTQSGTDYKPAIASVSANYEDDADLYEEITSLIAANPDMELLVFFVPTVDFKAWVACHKAINAAKA